MSEVDDNRDGVVSWAEYLQDAFGVDTEEEVGPEDTGDSGMVGVRFLILFSFFFIFFYSC